MMPRVLILALALLTLVAATDSRAQQTSAEALMSQGRSAITREDYAAAVRAFTGLLALPENPLTRDAQEFLALSYERGGDMARARREYEKYLARYPDGADSVRVRQRLASLRPAPPPEALHAPAQTETGSRFMVFGSLSQFYYRGNSRIETQPVVANAFDSTTLSLIDQSALVSNIDFNTRYLSDSHDNRFVFRDTALQNFLPGQDDRNRLTALYYDYRYKPADISARLGRQPGYSGGVLGRFDGALVGLGVTPRWRLNAVGGEPVLLPGFGIDSKQRFYGVNTDLGPFGERWSGNLYVIRQTVDGIPDREATGMELRYLAPQGALIALVDYDTLFRETNIAMVQANWQSAHKTTYTFLLDRRRTPSLQTATAVLGEATTSIARLLDLYSEEELRARAKALTATATTGSAGFVRAVSERWQLGLDYRAMRISATEGTSTMPGIPSTGYVHTAGAQAIGTGLISRRDVTTLSFNRVAADTYQGSAFSLNSRMPIGEAWMLGASLLLYEQRNDNGSTAKRVFGTGRIEYRWRTSVTLELEAGVDDTRNLGDVTQERLNRNFFSLGYRWDY
jgi:tetratricopeptide repeat protein